MKIRLSIVSLFFAFTGTFAHAAESTLAPRDPSKLQIASGSAMLVDLQTNKVKYMASFVHLIHGVDSLKLLQEIDKQAKKAGRIQDVLLQFYIAQEDTKFGLNLQEAKEILASIEFQQLKRIQVCGVMGMASNTSDEKQVAREFTELKKIFGTLQNKYFRHAPAFKEISMGMSGDYQLAIQNGSTMVRVGSKIFGGR